MNKELIFTPEPHKPAEKCGFISGNFMALTLIYSTCLFILNIVTILIAFR